MPLSAGSRLGPYEIVGPLGAGGMGEVYRARDVRLGREVAIKALPGSLTLDGERTARFEREAQILATLNHPHIAAIYGLEETPAPPGSTRASQYLILELVDGGTLANVLTRGPLPVRDALTIGRQVADALEAAHDKGIIHRDLKPGNIALTASGQAKVLDFGLAKALAPEPDAPTSLGATQAGVILGTAAYMSPEQARGLPLDKRSDIWSFGCVLYEALTARQPFLGETISDTIVAILGRDPDWSLIPTDTPPRVQWLLRRCLERDPRRRLHDIADARIELEEALARPAGTDAISPAAANAPALGRMAARERVAWIVAGLCLAGLAAAPVFLGHTPPTPSALPAYRSSIQLEDNLRLFSGEDPSARFALSPDGRRLAVVAADHSGQPMLWVRPLDGLLAQRLAGTEGASYPFWSPDSHSIGFIARPLESGAGLGRKLKTIDITDGRLSTLTDVSFSATGAWNRDDVILFTPTGGSPLCRISAAGGASTRATTLDASSGDVQHSFASFLPDGRHFLYSSVGSRSGGATEPRAVHVASLNPKEPSQLLLQGSAQARYANGHLVFLRDGTLMAQPFDLDRLQLQGTASTLAERIQMAGSAAGGIGGAFSLSDTGVLAYQSGMLVRSQLEWFDRSGRQIGALGDLADYAEVGLSSNGSRAAVSVLDAGVGTRDLWIFDVARGVRERFTSDPGDDFAPVWSPDGARIVFSSLRNGSIDLYQKNSGGSGPDALLNVTGLTVGKFASSWSPDGKYVLFIAGGRVIARSDLWVLPLSPKAKPVAFVETPFIESQARFSRDGRWIAYSSNESGRLEIYVQAFPGPGDKQRVSAEGGMWPQWSHDGTELYFMAPNNMLMSAAISTRDGGARVGAMRPLFPVRLRPPVRLDAYPYDLSPDDQRFLINTFVDEPTSGAITLVVNWTASLKRPPP